MGNECLRRCRICRALGGNRLSICAVLGKLSCERKAKKERYDQRPAERMEMSRLHRGLSCHTCHSRCPPNSCLSQGTSMPRGK
ncbi:hypothetical protein HYPSUDRAFT_290313 [Hypholoma sublateritium FD-334 SS-4]|uniref:Uncharacterized protein n=1 Tax=Hypholoma sublateritium (strain FD-334 SS-4) TaxID=945553 RepID=A0A0D2NIQ1_HYPSF|nr:hypothetical protein HYPSUDRAFT_290313 [Hypholoma sublateritium FD-334 SS-4]